MFGLTKAKKPTRASLEARIEFLEAQNRELVAEANFIKSELVENGNEFESEQKRYGRLWSRYCQLRERGVVEADLTEFRAYCAEVQREIVRHRPEPSALIAALAAAGKLTQGVYTQAPEPPILTDVVLGERLS